MGKLIRLELFSMLDTNAMPYWQTKLTMAARLQVLQGPPHPLVWRLVLHLHHRPQWLRKVKLVRRPFLYPPVPLPPSDTIVPSRMDAISFVLGIKSSQLRSTQLRDLVYRGRVMKTSKIQDDGTAAPAANGHANGLENGDDDDSQRTRGDPKTAWVMAVYEDDAGDEQKWKRSITSNGSSEYRVNDRVVTATQYNDALETENILIKARNFLVFQGDVEAIAAQSPQDLTRLIEQISGSLDYKAEYERLQVAVDQAAENQNFQLHRRRGINSEIKQYQEQKKEAENFQKKTEERDEAVIKHILWKLFHYQDAMDESSAKIQEHHDNLKEFRRNVDSFEKKLEAARKEQTSVGREVNKIEKTIKLKEKSIEDRENSLVPINEKIAQSTQDISTLRKRIRDVKKDKEAQTANIQKLKKDLATVEKAQQQFEKQWSDTLKKQGKELSDADRKEYTTLQAEVMKKSMDNRTKLANLERQLKSDEVTVNSLKGKIDNFQSAVDKLQVEVQTVKDRRDGCQDAVRAISGDIDSKKKEYGAMHSERIRVNNKFTELHEKLDDVLKKLEDAQFGQAQNSKEARVRQMVADLKRIYPGVRGRISELCKPTQKKYDGAIIMAMGREFDAVVVDTEKTGTDCVQFLKEQRFQPMTFIPLDNIKVSSSNSAVKGIPGARLTIDTIEFDPALERAIAYACGGSVVCDTEDIAKGIVYGRKIQVKCVTLDGRVIHKGGNITGGRLPEEKGGKGRRFEEHDVQNLERMADKLRDEMRKLPQSGRQGTAEETLQNEIEILERRLQAQKSELLAFEKNLKGKQKELEHQKRQLSEYEPKYDEKADELESTRSTVVKFKKAISDVEDKIFAGFCKRLGYEDIRAYEAQQGSLEQEAAQKRQDFNLQKERIQSNLTWETSQQSATNERVRNLEESLVRHTKDVEAYEQEKADIEAAMVQDQDQLDALQETLEEYKATHAAKTKKVAEAKQDLQKKNKEIEGRLKEIRILEANVQKNSAGKLALLRRCKLEQIQIPLNEGSLDDIPNEDVMLQQDQDAMDIDGEDDEAAEAQVLEAALDDYGIGIDFDSLDDDLKEVRPPFSPFPPPAHTNSSAGRGRRGRRPTPRKDLGAHGRAREAQPQHARHRAPRIRQIAARIDGKGVGRLQERAPQHQGRLRRRQEEAVRALQQGLLAHPGANLARVQGAHAVRRLPARRPGLPRHRGGHGHAVPVGHQVPRHAAAQALPRHGAPVGRREDHGRAGTAVCHPQLPAESVFRVGRGRCRAG